MTVRGLLAAFCLAVAASLAVVPGAVGELTYDGCLANDGSDGCVDLPGTPLTGASSVAVGPSGTVYATAFGANSILHFFAGAQGRLSYDGCLAADGSGGCSDLPGTPLLGASSVAVAPSGTVYATAGSGSILHFFTAPKGQLSYDGCLADDGSGGCIDLPGTPLAGASSVAVAPSGTVYATAVGANSFLHFFAGAQGQLSYDGCLADDGSNGCSDLPGTPLSGASSVAVAPSGTVYATAFGANSILHSFAAPQGQLSYDGCLANDGSDGCVDLPGAPLDQPTSVAVSPDGRSVYVTAFSADSITTFSTAPAGADPLPELPVRQRKKLRRPAQCPA